MSVLLKLPTSGEVQVVEFSSEATKEQVDYWTHALRIGMAWIAADEACPWYRVRSVTEVDKGWEAVAVDGHTIAVGTGKTPTAALAALAKKLRANR